MNSKFGKDRIVAAINTPLGFFVIALLVVEVFLAAFFIRMDGTELDIRPYLIQNKYQAGVKSS